MATRWIVLVALVLAAIALQIKVLDHVILSTDAVFSFRKEGLL